MWKKRMIELCYEWRDYWEKSMSHAMKEWEGICYCHYCTAPPYIDLPF